MFFVVVGFLLFCVCFSFFKTEVSISVLGITVRKWPGFELWPLSKENLTSSPNGGFTDL